MPRVHRHAVACCVAAVLAWGASTSCFAQAETPAAKGRAVYEQHCLTCHGIDMVNPGTASYDLRKFPKDQKPRFERSVTEGKAPGMPAWRGVVTPEELEALWAYVMTGGK